MHGPGAERDAGPAELGLRLDHGEAGLHPCGAVCPGEACILSDVGVEADVVDGKVELPPVLGGHEQFPNPLHRRRDAHLSHGLDGGVLVDAPLLGVLVMEALKGRTVVKVPLQHERTPDKPSPRDNRSE